MSFLSQLHSQLRQIVFFKQYFPLSSLLEHAIMFPFDYAFSSGKARYPLAFNFLITARCNLRCTMCNYVDNLVEYARDELSLADINTFLERESSHKLHIFISGGEPFMRQDCVDIIKLIKARNHYCGVCTNGTLLTDEKIDELISASVDYMIFSLHGPRTVHAAITGKPDAFDKITAAIAKFKRTAPRVKLFINCAISNANCAVLSDVVDCAEHLGVDALRFEHCNFVTKEELNNHAAHMHGLFTHTGLPLATYVLDAPSQEWHMFHRGIAVLQQRMKHARIPVFLKPYLNNTELASWYSPQHTMKRRCVFVWQSLFINPQGAVYPCQFYPYTLGSLKTDTITGIWNSPQYRELRRALKKGLFPGCMRCCKL